MTPAGPVEKFASGVVKTRQIPQVSTIPAVLMSKFATGVIDTGGAH
jgi:hypothetical protein